MERFDTDVPVMEIMSRNPVTIREDETVSEAANIMKDRDVSALVVVQGKRVIGIITENDVVTKVVAQDQQPSKVMVREVMSKPVIDIHPHATVSKAARKMSEEGIRRLVVCEDSNLEGVVTENDILRIWPELIELTREYQRIGMTELGVEKVEGYCENCNIFSRSLVSTDGQLLCPECRER